MSDKARVALTMSIQWLLLAGLVGTAFMTKPRSVSPLHQVLAIVTFAAGVAVGGAALVAHRKKNDSFLVSPSPRPSEAAGLVTSGIYSRIRHPIYLAVILVACATALWHWHWTSLSLAGSITVFYPIKVQFEERLLLRRYPEYAKYQESTGKLLPPIFKKAEKR